MIIIGSRTIARASATRRTMPPESSLGITSILVAHELAAVRRVADHIYLLAGGKIVAHGVPEDLARGETPWTRQFFSGEADGPVPFHYPAPDYATQLGLDGGVPSPALRARDEDVAPRHPDPRP